MLVAGEPVVVLLDGVRVWGVPVVGLGLGCEHPGALGGQMVDLLGVDDVAFELSAGGFHFHAGILAGDAGLGFLGRCHIVGKSAGNL